MYVCVVDFQGRKEVHKKRVITTDALKKIEFFKMFKMFLGH